LNKIDIMETQISVIVTSIAKPNKVLRRLARGCKEHGFNFIIIGDVSSPVDFRINNCQFYSLKRQRETNLKYPRICPQRHYSRKNVGYLFEIQKGTEIIFETDDDNLPYQSFWDSRNRVLKVPTIKTQGWVNVYRYFTNELIWPRGLPLNKINMHNQLYESLPIKTVDCPIQQGLVNNNPDVDAVFRLIHSKSIVFSDVRKLALAKGVWCPFNSQNTAWWKDAFPLLYLPSYCSFRMTDIIRSFVAQRIAWENDWAILFHEPTMWQERNKHDLMKDFNDEIPGYLNNEKTCDELEKLHLKRGIGYLTENLLICYEKLIESGVVNKREIQLLEKWIKDLEDINSMKKNHI